jgi:hypothetical protein
MAKSLINLGTTPNDRTGDTLRDAGSKMNQNINEIYNTIGNGSNLEITTVGATSGQVLKFNGTSFVPSTDLNTDAVTSVNTKVGTVVLGTDDIAEGTTNKYYTDARVRSALSASGALSFNQSTGAFSFTQGNTDTVAEGATNQYYTSNRFDFRLSQKTTNDLNEGTGNLYFSNARARNAISVTQNLTYNPTTGVITGPALASVATSGSYNDLLNKPPLGSTTQWVVDSSGTALNLTGNGFLGSEDNPTIYVYRGMRYEFDNQTGGILEFVVPNTSGVRSVTMTNGGLYFSNAAPTVSFTGGTGSGATGTVNLSTSGSIDSISVTDGGSGYTVAPTVSFSGVGAGATATAVLTTTGPIKNVTVTTRGDGYITAPTVSFTDSEIGAGGAIAVAKLAYPVRDVNFTSRGTGYTSAPTVVIGGSGTGATGTATISDGEIASVTITDGGSGYFLDNTTVPITFIGGGGTGAVATGGYSTTEGQVWEIQVTSVGTGYSSDVAVVLTGGSGTGATATANRDLSVDSITVTNGGSGYINPTVVISPNFAGGQVGAVTDTATATANLKYPVASVTITNPGSYSVAPNVVFSAGAAAGTAVLNEALVTAGEDFTSATVADNGSTILCPLMSTSTGVQWQYRLVGDEVDQVGDIVVV